MSQLKKGNFGGKPWDACSNSGVFCSDIAVCFHRGSLLNLTSSLSVVYNLLVKVTLLRWQLSVQIFLIWSKSECK